MRAVFAAVLTVTLAAACSDSLPKQVPYDGSPRPLSEADWPALLSQRTAVEVVPLLTGEIEVDRSVLLDLDDTALVDHEDRATWVPVLAYLVRHPEHGDFLVDSGFDSTFAESGHGNFGGLATFASFARQDEGHDTVALVQSLGVAPESLRSVFLSHMHSDHTAGLPELPKTVPLVSGPGAILDWEDLSYAPAGHLDGFAQVQELDFTSAADAGPGRSLDVFGDGSFIAIETPGHTRGNLSFLVISRTGPVLLTCDASHTAEGYALGVEPGKTVDRAQAEASLDRLRAFTAAHPEIRVKHGHEAADWDMSRGVQDTL